MPSIPLASTFDPLACEKKLDPIPADLVPLLAVRAMKQSPTDLPILRELLKSAIAHKMTSVEQISEELGLRAADVAKGKKNPDPVTHRAVLNFVANLEVA